MVVAQLWTGEELERLRRAAGLRQADVAGRMGVTRSRVSLLEGSRRVTDAAARRFLTAVADLRASQ
jgi:transcriptional regulator with XRE-family HTH domain